MPRLPEPGVAKAGCSPCFRNHSCGSSAHRGDAPAGQVAVLLRLHGALNVAVLEAVYEDAAAVHLVMELCRGGELLARARSAHYSERTVPVPDACCMT